MSQSPKRPSLSEASEASQPLLNSTESEAGKNNVGPLPTYTESISTQAKDGVTTAGLNPVPDLPAVLKAGDTLTQHHDPELDDGKDEPPQSQCTELPACGEESAPEIQIAHSASRALSRSPKRSSSPDASDTLPKPKRHEREPPGDELESLRKPHITLPPPGTDILATERLGLLPDHGDGEDEHAPKQTVDSSAGSDSSGAVSHPSQAPKLSSTPHLPPLTDESAAPGEPTSPSLPVQAHANALASEEDQAPRWALHFTTYSTLIRTEETAISALWNSFKSAVQMFAQFCLPNKCSWDELPTTHQEEVRTWASNPEDYLNSNLSPDVTSFYAAWLFRLLDRHLFSGKDRDKWDGPDWQSFGAIWASGKAHLREPNGLFAVKYHHWRNLSVQTLADMHPERRHVDPLWLRKKIEEWMEHLPFASETDQSEYEYEWEQLMKSAINMDSLIITARRNIKMRLSDSATHKDHGFPFVPDKMTPCIASMQRRRVGMDKVVDFVIFPTLLAYGKNKNTTFGPEERPAESVLCPFGRSWDEVSEEISMVVYCR